MSKRYVSSHLREPQNGSHFSRQVVLETEFDNYAALALYESLGFIREKRLYRFYLNGKDAYRLVLPTIPYDGISDGTPPPQRGYPLARKYIAISGAGISDNDSDDEVSSR